MLMKTLAAGAATTAIALSMSATAHAQTTAVQAQEVIVTGNHAPRSTGGLATQVNDAKDESIIGRQYIETQVPSANVGQLINTLPGVSYSTEDPGGFNSGDLRIHGFDGTHIAFILDGSPLNDTGNYAVYPGEYMIGELIDHITVNIGGSDVDSPSPAALGATINVVTKKPKNDMGGQVSLSGGSYGYGRAFGEFDTGRFGPFGTTAYIAGEYGREDNFFDRPGENKRWDISGRIYQPLRGSDFISIAGIYTQERQNPPYNASQAQIDKYGPGYFGDNLTFAPVPAPVAGKADTIPSVSTGADNLYYNLYSNPVNFASIRGQSKFTLGRGLSFTFDPSFFYTLAGVGQGSALSEKDSRLIGNATTTAPNKRACVVGGKVTGVDLNGDGDCLDTVVTDYGSNSETYRYSLSSSLLYDLDEHNHFQLAYAGDLGRHRETGQYTTVDQNTGNPASVFGGKPGYGPPILTADNSVLQNRDRYSIAILNQLSANYIGKFLNDRLHVNIGVRAPWFERKLQNNCYQYAGTGVGAAAAECTTVSPTRLAAAYETDLTAHRGAGATATALSTLLSPVSVSTGAGGVPNFVAPTLVNGVATYTLPFRQDFNFNKVLPNAGISYRPVENSLFYASYEAGFAAPKTSDLYISSSNAQFRPETSDNYAIGYRYQTRNLTGSINLYDTEFRHRIVASADPVDPTISIDRDVGNVNIRGIDLEAGWTPIEHLRLYGSANFNKSALRDDIDIGSTFSGAAHLGVLQTKGKELVLTPDRIFNLRASYDMGPITVGMNGRYMSSRYVTDVNDARIPGFAVFGFDARYTLPTANRTYIQMNIQNLFNRYYISRASTSNSAAAVPIAGSTATINGSTTYLWLGAPSTFSFTLHSEF